MKCAGRVILTGNLTIDKFGWNRNNIENMSVESTSIDRSKFGPEEAGQSAWELIASVVLCSFEGCERQAVGTTDFDVLGDLTQLPHCSEEHHKELLFQVAYELNVQGRFISPSKNGWGRA